MSTGRLRPHSPSPATTPTTRASTRASSCAGHRHVAARRPRRRSSAGCIRSFRPRWSSPVRRSPTGCRCWACARPRPGSRSSSSGRLRHVRRSVAVALPLARHGGRARRRRPAHSAGAPREGGLLHVPRAHRGLDVEDGVRRRGRDRACPAARSHGSRRPGLARPRGLCDRAPADESKDAVARHRRARLPRLDQRVEGRTRCAASDPPPGLVAGRDGPGSRTGSTFDRRPRRQRKGRPRRVLPPARGAGRASRCR